MFIVPSRKFKSFFLPTQSSGNDVSLLSFQENHSEEKPWYVFVLAPYSLCSFFCIDSLVHSFIHPSIHSFMLYMLHYKIEDRCF